jgi:hypothetical protein
MLDQEKRSIQITRNQETKAWGVCDTLEEINAKLCITTFGQKRQY